MEVKASSFEDARTRVEDAFAALYPPPRPSSTCVKALRAYQMGELSLVDLMRQVGMRGVALPSGLRTLVRRAVAEAPPSPELRDAVDEWTFAGRGGVCCACGAEWAGDMTGNPDALRHAPACWAVAYLLRHAPAPEVSPEIRLKTSRRIEGRG